VREGFEKQVATLSPGRKKWLGKVCQKQTKNGNPGIEIVSSSHFDFE
jgi:hypothetical protein